MAGERVLVTIADGHAIDDVSAALEAAGLQVEKVLRAVGVVVGTCDGAQRTALSAVTGVGSVEADREVRLPPPGDDVQ